MTFDFSAGSHFGRRDMYALLHNYNVECVSARVLYRQRYIERHARSIDFATREEADTAQAVLDGFVYKGEKLIFRRWQLPRKYIGVSWDNGRPGRHFSGERDQGSAVGTNFERVRSSLSSGG